MGENAIVIADTSAPRALTTEMDVNRGPGHRRRLRRRVERQLDPHRQCHNRVLLGSGVSLTGYDGVDIEAKFPGVDTFAYSRAHVTGLFGYVESNANNTTTLTSTVVADPRTDSAARSSPPGRETPATRT